MSSGKAKPHRLCFLKCETKISKNSSSSKKNTYNYITERKTAPKIFDFTFHLFMDPM